MAGLILPADDYLHAPSDHHLWNESAWFALAVPERHLSGFVYVNHRPNLGHSMTGVALYDPSGEQVYNCLYYDWNEFAPLSSSTNTEMFDFTTPNSLSMRCIEPLRTYAMTYDRNGCQLDLQWTATMDAFNAGFPPGSDGWGPNHYEQAGRMTGTIRINGEDITVDCGSNRDHSWGVRDYTLRSLEDFPRHDFPWFNDGRGYAMNMYTVPAKPPLEDPIVGVTDVLLGGWIAQDDKVARIVTGSRAAERRPDGVPRIIVMDGTDELGRSFEAEGRVLNVIQWTGLSSLLVYWGLVEWTLGDGTKVFGEMGEVFPAALGRRFLRSL